MDPMEKLPLPEAGRAELSEAKQQADMLWQQADGREGGPGFSGLLSGNTGSASVNQRGHGAVVYSFPEPPE